jgi:hypothetical protein
MNRLISTLAGLMLIALGALALLSNIALALFGINLAPYVAALVWAPFLLGVGCLFVATPLVNRQQRSLGGLFIPGLPILAAGGVTLLATLMPWWHIWARLWPVVVLALAAGFICLALHLRVIWIVIPAIFVGLNGLALQFCALTGLWGAWAVLWAVEPLGVGLTLLLTASQTRSTAVFVVGLIFCAFSSVVMTGLMVLLPGLWRLAGFASAGGFVLLGLMLIAWALFGSRRPAVSTASPSPANQA